jgi:hypothetical protein
MPYHHELIMPEEIATPSPIKVSWLIGTLAAFSIFALIAGYSARMTNDYSDYDSQRAQDRYDTLAKLRDAANKTLTTADWVDQDKGTIRIPIDEAMSKEIDTLKSKPVVMGAVIPGTTPAPAPAAAPAAPATDKRTPSTTAPAPAPTTSASPAKPNP